MAGVLLSNLLAGLWLGAHPEDADVSLGGQGLATLGLWVGLAGSAAFATYRKGNRSLRTDFGLAFRPLDVPIGVVTGVVAQVVLVPLIAVLLRPLVGDPDVSGPTRKTIESADGVGLAFLVLFVVVGAALVEELFFRGLLLRALERRFSTGWAVGLAAVMFGLAHPQALPVDALVVVMVSLSALGAVLAVLAVRSGRLGPSIFAHATFNLWTVIFLLAE